jgi:lipopolysaccharide transport system ATP-binding protein
MRPIIRIQGLGKRYKIGERVAYGNLRESITHSLSSPAHALRSLLGRARNNGDGEDDGHIWALRDVSLDIMPGEVVGVIGRNGAGKSTLLKILSRITEPTSGRVDLYGRVGSLLEVGTGFHQELTGRENIYLSAAILGMRRAEIDRKFDEIVAFAEIEKFIDTPAKHYSSGMYVRLAFAVAAHLEPEILLVDEVLAVGDSAFQKRCLGKMGDVARQGRTVVLVSHNMSSIEGLCGSCLYIRAGRLEGKGEPDEMIARYLASDLNHESGKCSLANHPGRSAIHSPLMTAVELLSEDGMPSNAIRMGSSLRVKVSFNCPSQPLHPVLSVAVKTMQQAPVFAVSNRHITEFLFSEKVSSGTITCTLDRLPLMPGTYYLDLSFGSELLYNIDVVQEAISFDVNPVDVFGSGKLPPAASGPVFWPASFELDTENGRSMSSSL